MRPVWSPLGGQIAYLSLQKSWLLYMIDENFSEPRPMGVPIAPDDTVVWSPDGTKLAVPVLQDGDTSRPTDIVVLDLQNGQTAVITSNNTAKETIPSWSPALRGR